MLISKTAGGGALVTTTNKTVQSDLRLYESDNNKTMEKFVSCPNSFYVILKVVVRLSQSPEQFNSICTNLIARMIDVRIPSILA